MAHELSLSVKPGNWRLFMQRRHDSKFHPIMQKVLDRDFYTCQFCGFQARDFQEVVNLDQNYFNNRISNLVTSCCFCTQCHFLEFVGQSDYGGGTLVHLPEMKQAEVNSFCHVLFCAMANGTGYKSSAQAIYRSMKFRSKAIEQRYGEGSSDPAVMGRLIIETKALTPEQQMVMLKDVRLLPSRAKFRAQIERWAEAALEEMAADNN